MNERRNEELLIEILFIFVLAIIILLSLTILKDLMMINNGYDHDRRIEYNMKRKAKIVTVLVLFLTLYFLFITYRTYKEVPTKTNYIFLIISLLVSIAAILRVLNVYSRDVEISGIEDLIF